jgi:hypothetical protein
MNVVKAIPRLLLSRARDRFEGIILREPSSSKPGRNRIRPPINRQRITNAEAGAIRTSMTAHDFCDTSPLPEQGRPCSRILKLRFLDDRKREFPGKNEISGPIVVKNGARKRSNHRFLQEKPRKKAQLQNWRCGLVSRNHAQPLEHAEQ